MKKIIIIFAILTLTVMLICDNKKEDNIVIPKESIRFRIIAASNTAEDQLIKEVLLKTLINEINEITNATTIEESRLIIKNNIAKIEETLNKKLNTIKIEEKLKVTYGNNYFPKKIYKGVEYPEGYYESLVVEIGKAEGDNFWCVLFPPLCMLENTTEDEIEYKFFVKEIINKIFKN